MADDFISIEGLALVSRIGVPDAERAVAQHLRASVELFPKRPLTGIEDDFSRTIDYDAAARCLRRTAAEGERKLLETLAEDLANDLLDSFPLRKVRVEVRKFILSDTQSVGVVLTKHADPVECQSPPPSCSD